MSPRYGGKPTAGRHVVLAGSWRRACPPRRPAKQRAPAGRMSAQWVACQRGDPPALRETAAVGAGPDGAWPPTALAAVGTVAQCLGGDWPVGLAGVGSG